MSRGVPSIAKQASVGRVAFLVLKRKERGSSGQVMRDRLADAGGASCNELAINEKDIL